MHAYKGRLFSTYVDKLEAKLRLHVVPLETGASGEGTYRMYLIL